MEILDPITSAYPILGTVIALCVAVIIYLARKVDRVENREMETVLRAVSLLRNVEDGLKVIAEERTTQTVWRDRIDRILADVETGLREVNKTLANLR